MLFHSCLIVGTKYLNLFKETHIMYHYYFKIIPLTLITIVSLMSCGGRKIKPEPLAATIYEDDYSSVGYIDVPFTYQGGVRYIQVKINNCTEFPMIFDTGCSGMAISMLELATLVKHGYITDEDIIGSTSAQIADGSIVEETVVNLRNVKIGEYECADVYASVADNIGAPLLLGNGALKNVQRFQVDDDNQVIRFYLK